jgi:Type II secretion system (T2SS), protein E, N-terminal domain
MGFFGGKKDKKNDVKDDTSSLPRKSRRIVAPVAKGSSPSVGDNDAPAAPQPNNTAVVKPMAPRPPAPPRAMSDRVMKASSPSTPEIISAPPRPKGKDPISVGSSKPPEFTGGLTQATRRGDGPARTGDAALFDFLQNKTKLLDADQVGQVKGKAETEAKPIDAVAVELGFISEEQMVNALTQECWVPHLKVDKYEIRKKALDTITKEDALYFGVFPVDKLGSLLTLAMVNPLDAATIQTLETKTGLDIKKVVATRSEISQGIEKYYSGKVEARDTSISFTQDIEPKSVTQMLSKVATSAAPSPAPVAPPSRSMPAITSVPPPAPADNIVPEIQDIDDLLSSDEAIAPAIIEPISLKADEAEVVSVEPLEMESFDVEPVIPAARPARDVSTPSGEFATLDAPTAKQDSLTKKHAPVAPAAFEIDHGDAPAIKPADKAASPAPEFEMDDGAAPVIKPPVPAAKAPAPVIKPPAPIIKTPLPTAPAPAAKAPVATSAPSAPPRMAPPAAVPPPPVARPAPPAVRSPTSSFARAGDAQKPATSRLTGPGRADGSGIIHLIPVTEDEFQHAITHGKSHVFEKWVGLQSRNRIINVVAVEEELDGVLASLYAGAKVV